MTDLKLIQGKPKIFTISSEELMLSQIKEYVEDYEYEYVGSASEKDEIFKKIDELSPNLIFLDTEEQGLDLLETASDLELFNVPVIIIVGDVFDATIDQLLMSNPYNYLLKPVDKDELQRAMAVSLKKHEQNILSVQTAQNRIQEKNTELLIEKSDSSFLLILCVALIIIAILSRNATWLQWVLLIPTLAMLINSFVSLKKQKEVIPFEEEDLPFISIFIPAHNEQYTIESTVRSVCDSDYTKMENQILKLLSLMMDPQTILEKFYLI